MEAAKYYLKALRMVENSPNAALKTRTQVYSPPTLPLPTLCLSSHLRSCSFSSLFNFYFYISKFLTIMFRFWWRRHFIELEGKAERETAFQIVTVCVESRGGRKRERERAGEANRSNTDNLESKRGAPRGPSRVWHGDERPPQDLRCCQSVSQNPHFKSKYVPALLSLLPPPSL